ncbi:hypothetical protein ACFCYX_24575 [Streptomyces populi]|uniref:hypothetical protein n=1 Tax=Streptomyces populi TaxID=2058924 RepID=UPI0013A708A0|nr:hypothetical protein [Streptomyces populi]
MNEAAEESEGPATTAALRQLLKRALWEDPAPREELTALFPAPAPGVTSISA